MKRAWLLLSAFFLAVSPVPTVKWARGASASCTTTSGATAILAGPTSGRALITFANTSATRAYVCYCKSGSCTATCTTSNYNFILEPAAAADQQGTFRSEMESMSDFECVTSAGTATVRWSEYVQP